MGYFRFGFLDGKEGKIYTFLQAYWYRFLVDAKIYECKKEKKVIEKQNDLKVQEKNEKENTDFKWTIFTRI